MNFPLRTTCAALVVVSLCVGPASAQYANEYVPAKLIKQGTTTHSIAGNGTVVVQVQVNADGSHKAIRVIKSSNSGDNAAAMDIAQTSTYRPAHRGQTPITAFYDFTLKFNGKAVVNNSDESTGPSVSSGSLSPAAQQVAALIRQHNYAAAQSKAQAGLLNAPDDQSLRQMLGVAAYNAGDYTAAAAAFDKVPTIGSQFKQAASLSLAAAAVKGAQSNPSQALGYAQKAVALDPTTNTRFALGVAQLASGDNATALATLKAAHDAAMNDPKIPKASKVNIDSELLQAYLANNDQKGAQATAAEIKQLDPNSSAGAAAMGSTLIKNGQAAVEAKDTATALSDFDKAAALGDPQIAVTANTLAAFAISRSAKPDYKQMQAYADKALAIKPNDAQANFAEGIALTGEWTASHSDDTKKSAAAALDKADQQAKAEGNEALSLQIETFVKKYLNATPGAQSGGGG
jgi:TonB family protein